MPDDNMILKINNIEVKYHEVILVIKGVSIEVPEGGIVAYSRVTPRLDEEVVRCPERLSKWRSRWG